eukprot:403375370
MFKSRDCFSKSDMLANTDYVFHTAAPLITSSNKSESEDQIRMYCEATQNLVESSIKHKVKKIVFMGAASSIIGQHPVQDKGFIYSDAMVWVDPKTMHKPNERAKLLSEKVCWNSIKKQEPNQSSKTNLISLLPYFMIGQPLYKSIISQNSSCLAINSILNHSQYGFPQVQLPLVDVKDVAQAHVNLIRQDILKNLNGRFLVSSQSKWFSEIIQILKNDRQNHGKKIKIKILGNFTLALGRLINPEIKHLMPFIDQELHINGTDFERVFGIQYSNVEQSLREMAQQIVRLQEGNIPLDNRNENQINNS